MSDYGIEPFRTIFNAVCESIYIKKVFHKFIIFDDFDDCGELCRNNVKRKVFIDEDGRPYINYYIGKLQRQDGPKYKIYLN